MLKKTYKLSSFEIKDLFIKKDTPFKIFRGVFFDIKFFIKKDSLNTKNIDKIAVILSSKNFKKAVDRNKIRRRIYSICEKYTKENKKNTENKESKSGFKNNFCILIYPKKEIKNVKFLDLQKEVYNSLNNNLK